MITKLDSVRRQALINSALREFSIKGYDRASTNEIAKNANLSKALMFHYTQNKESLFLYLIDYCQEVITHKYVKKMNYEERDLLLKLHQSYMLQLKLLKKNPWILEFSKLLANTNSSTVNIKIKQSSVTEVLCSSEKLFHSIDITKFKEDIDVSKAKKLIFWTNVGFIDQIIKDIQYQEIDITFFDQCTKKIDVFFEDLRSIFYI